MAALFGSRNSFNSLLFPKSAVSAKDTMVAFRQEVNRILGGKDGLPDEWDKTAEMLRKTAETVLGVTFGKRKEDKETWWWNEGVQESIKEKKEAKKAWDKIRNENTKRYTKKRRVRQRRQLRWQRDVCMIIFIKD